MDRKQTDLIQLLLGKDSLTKNIKNGSKTSAQATQCTDNKQTIPTMPQTH